MPWVPYPDEKGSDEVRRVFDEVQRARGSVANLWRVMGNDPRSLALHLELFEHLQISPGPLSRREREMVGVVVAKTLRCDYAFTHHLDALGRYVREPGLVALLASHWRSAPISPREREILEFAEALTKDPSTIQPPSLESLRKVGLSEGEILHLILLVGELNALHRVALGTGIERDDAPQPYLY